MIKFIYIIFLITILVLKTTALSTLNILNSDESTKYVIYINSSSTATYDNNYIWCGGISIPCITFGDAGDRARIILKENFTGSDELEIKLLNPEYDISDYCNRCSFGNLFGFSSIIIDNYLNNGSSSDSYENIIFDGTDLSNSSEPLLSIQEISQYSNSLQQTYIEISNMTYKNFGQNSTIFYTNIISSPLDLFQIYNSNFYDITSMIFKTEPYESDSGQTFEPTIVLSSCRFSGISPQSTSESTFQIIQTKLQLLSCTVENSIFQGGSFIYINNGGLRVFLSEFTNNTGNSEQENSQTIPMINLINSGINIQIESVIFSKNQDINCFLQIYQTIPTMNYNSNYEYVVLNSLTINENTFNSIPSNNGVISNGGFINLISNQDDISFTRGFQDIKFSSNDGNLVSQISLISITNGNALLNGIEFQDQMNFSNLDLINTNITLVNYCSFYSTFPFTGRLSNISYDETTYFSSKEYLYECSGCAYNGITFDIPNHSLKPGYIALIVIGLIIIFLISLILFYRFYGKQRIDSYIKRRIKLRKDLKYSFLDDSPSEESKQYLIYNHDIPSADVDVIEHNDYNNSDKIQVAGDVDDIYIYDNNPNQNGDVAGSD